jgi:crotonobetainyl-CoA:carnitine CoA-transferase CaiB-like acyl-CoA transferase
MEAADSPGGPLAGLRVLDLIDDLGAYGPRLLAGLGADVIRLEPPSGSRHRARRSTTAPWQVRDSGGGLYFLHYNAGKRGITLDTTEPEGAELLGRLLDWVDVVLDNGALRSLGLDASARRDGERPLTIVSVTPFGLDGPRSDWRGCDLICQAMSGMLGLYGYHGERPARFSPEQGSEITGLAAALGALIGRYGSRATGRGTSIDIAAERVCALVTLQMQNASLFHQFGFVRPRAERTAVLPQGLFETSDGFVAFNPWRDPETTIDLLEDQGCGSGLRTLYESLPRERFVAHPEVTAALDRLVSERTRNEVAELVQSWGLLGLPVNDSMDLLNDPFLVARGFFVDLQWGDRTLKDSGVPIRFSRTPARVGVRPPLLGEHNSEVYEELGIGTKELARLREKGIV